MKNAKKKLAKKVAVVVKADPIIAATRKAINLTTEAVAASAALATIDALIKRAKKDAGKKVIVPFLDEAYAQVKAGGGQDGGDASPNAPPEEKAG